MFLPVSPIRTESYVDIEGSNLLSSHCSVRMQSLKILLRPCQELAKREIDGEKQEKTERNRKRKTRKRKIDKEA